ncbi:MAG: molecular chaperone DnaK, partial [Thermoanaerobaculia bacterium]
LEQALEGAKQAQESDSLEKLEAAISELTSASHKLAEAMYEKADAEPTGPSGAGPADPAADADGGGDEVIDAEYVDVDEQAK